MLFNSYAYLFLFLPFSVISYFLLARYAGGRWAIALLVIASFVFYAYWDFKYLLLLISSVLFNFSVGTLLQSKKLNSFRYGIVIFGIIVNLSILWLYKYSDFMLENLNAWLGWHVSLFKFTLPLGISFFSFTQIAYLVDSYNKEIQNNNMLNYFLFVTFFPHLLAGPIIHHKEMMPQFSDYENGKANWKNIYFGIALFAFGLFKKSVLADHFSSLVDHYYDHLGTQALGFFESWSCSLSYSLQIYFDFSGYTDMAIGAAMLFNIILPINFNSPYKATSIQDFWRRWHITLSRFLRDYVYFPLGGNRISAIRTDLNIVIVFLIGGIWHGAGWTYLFWGVSHGLGYMVHRIWRKTKINLPKFLAILLTFFFINLTWVLFRSPTLLLALSMMKSMLAPHYFLMIDFKPIQEILLAVIMLILCMTLPNSQKLMIKIQQHPWRWYPVGLGVLLLIGSGSIALHPQHPFIYFQF